MGGGGGVGARRVGGAAVRRRWDAKRTELATEAATEVAREVGATCLGASVMDADRKKHTSVYYDTLKSLKVP